MAEPARQLPEEDQPVIRPNLRALEGGGESTPAESGHLSAVPDYEGDEDGAEDEESSGGESGGRHLRAIDGGKGKGSLADKEEEAGTGPSARDTINDRLNKGYTGKEGEKKSLTSRLFNGKGKMKKRAGIALAVGGGSLIGGFLVFMLMLPLKIESIVNNLDERFGAASSQAIDAETQNMFKQYIKKYVAPNLGKGRCHSTVDAACVALADHSSGPLSQMYNAWRQDRLENKLATKYNLSIGKSGGKYYINDNGKRIIFGSDVSDVFSDSHTTSGQRHEIEEVLSKRLKEGTLWDRIYYRFKLAPLLNEKYGIRHCINACKPINEFVDSYSTKKKAAKAYIIQRVVSPLSESYGLILQCVLEGNGCGTDLNPASPNDPERETEISSTLQRQLDAYIAAHSEESLAKLVGIANDIGQDGFQKVIARALAQKIGAMFGKDVSGEAATKLVPAIGWVLMIARVIGTLEALGPAIRYISYAANSAAAAQLYTTYQVVASEAKSGQTDATQLGSFTTALGSNLSGSADDRSDAAQTPLYQSLMSTNSTTTASSQTALLFGSFGGTASAITSNDQGGYTCDNGKPVPGGQTVCEEEKLDRGNAVANNISSSMHAITDKMPGFNGLVKAINFAGNIFGQAFGTVFQKGCDTVGRPFGCHAAMSWISAQAATFMTFLVQKLVATPITDNMSGGRIFDMMAAGADVSHNSSCQENLGCAHVSDQQAATIQHQYIADQQAQFNEQSLFARMFSTDSPYSLVSKVAVAMPSTATNAGISFASLFTTNPLTLLGRTLATAMPAGNAGAATLSSDPFGVPQSAYLPNQIPSDPEAYWNQNCMNGPEATYDATTNTLDTSAWQNNDANVTKDKNTGTAINLKPNKCLLIFSSLQSAGGLEDPSLLPQDSLNNANTEAGSKLRVASYNVLGQGHSPGNWQQRMADVVNVITSNNFDVVGFQELEVQQRAALLNAVGSTYAIFPQTPQYGGSESANSIIWNKTRFKLVDSGTQPNLKYFNGDPLAAPWVKLQDVSSGQQFYVLNTHDPAHSDAQDTYNRYQNALQHVKFIQSLQQGIPVLYTGDFNSGYSVDMSANPTYQGKAANLTYCIMHGGGMIDAYDADSGRSFNCPNPALGNVVDHVFVSSDATVSKFGQVTGNIGTDHRSVPYADVCLGNCSNSGAGSQFRAASFNMHNSSTPSENQTAITNMKKNNFQLVGMQELTNQGIFGSVKSKLLAAGYDMYPKQFTGTWGMNGNAIAWDTSKFQLVKTDKMVYPAGDKRDPAAPTTSPIIWLKDKGTGQEIIVTNVHTFAYGKTAAFNGPAIRSQASQVFTQTVQGLQSEKLPIIFTGDFNEGYGPNGTAYCMMETKGLMVSPFVDNPNDYCKSGGKVWAMGAVDHILTSPGIKGNTNELIGNPPKDPSNGVYLGLGTDHHQVPYSDITIPGTGKGGSNGGNSGGNNGGTGSFNLFGQDGFPGGSCVEYVEYVMRRHLPKYAHSPSTFGAGAKVADIMHSRYGYAEDHNPAPGAIVSYPAGYHANKYWGHVGIVRQVNADGSIVVQDSNYHPPDPVNGYGTHTVAASIASHLSYAHVEKDWTK